MKILVNARFLQDGALEGIGSYSFEILSRLTKLRPDDQFIFAFDRAFNDRFIFSDNVLPLIINPPARHALLFWWWYHIAIPSLYRKYQADLFFTPDGFTATSSVVNRTLITIHDLAYLHFPEQISRSNLWYYRHFMPKYIRKADHIITVSESSRADIVTHFPLASDKITTIYNGTPKTLSPISEEEKARIRADYTHGCPYFISIGALHPRKNIARLIEAFSMLRQRVGEPYKLVVVGRKAWQTNSIESALNRSSVREDVKFLNYVEDEVLQQLLGGAQALCYVSLFEGFGLPILEAMQAGVPVVTSNRSSMKEVAADAACLVDPTSTEDIHRGLVRVLDESYRRNLITRGFHRSRAFDWDQSAQAHHALFDQVMR